MVKINMADLEHFILHLHDTTRWPAEYFKAVIYYALAHEKDPDLEPPNIIHYSNATRKYQSSVQRTNVSGGEN